MKADLKKLILEAGGNDYDIERLHYLRAPSQLSKEKPTFLVHIILNPQFGSLVQKLTRGEGSYTAPPGQYACFPVWDWKTELLPPEEAEVTVPRRLLEQIEEAFRTRTISDEVWNGVQKALSGN